MDKKRKVKECYKGRVDLRRKKKLVYSKATPENNSGVNLV